MKKTILPLCLLTLALAAGPAKAAEPTAPREAAMKQLTEQTAARLLAQLRWMHRQLEQAAQAKLAGQGDRASAAEGAGKAGEGGEGEQHRWRHQHRNQVQSKGASATQLKEMLRSGRSEGSAGLEKKLQNRVQEQQRTRARQQTRAQSRMHQGAGGGSGAGHGRR